MGCASSKRVKAAVDVYRPPPSSFAVFDINAIQEPWLIVENPSDDQQDKLQSLPAPVPSTILQKLEDAGGPRSWDEVSKALQAHLKTPVVPPVQPPPTDHPPKEAPRKRSSFHTLEELDAKLSSKQIPTTELRKLESKNSAPEPPKEATTGLKSVKDNIFIVRDRQEREKEGTKVALKWDPLSEFPEKCPAGGGDSVVVYTTSLRGVRRTFDDCTRVRDILELQGVVFEERDVSLHGEYLREMRELVGEEVSVPRVFVKGRYVGGVEEVSELNESGKLGKLMRWGKVERRSGREACEGCGGARFVPCLDCGGSCKVFLEGDKRGRCGKCNENGLVYCPVCV